MIRITLQGTIFPGNMELLIRGFVSGGAGDSVLFFRYDYLNDAFPESQRCVEFRRESTICR